MTESDVATTCILKTKKYMTPTGEIMTSNSFLSFDVSTALNNVNVVTGRNVIFTAVDIYISKYLWQATSFWRTLSVSGNMGMIVDGESEIELTCYAINNAKLVITQSSSDSNDLVLRCYPVAYKMKSMSVKDCLPFQIKFLNDDVYTATRVGSSGWKWNIGLHTEFNVEYKKKVGGSVVTGTATAKLMQILLPTLTTVSSAGYGRNNDVSEASIVLSLDTGIYVGFVAYFQKTPYSTDGVTIISKGFINTYSSEQVADSSGYITITPSTHPIIIAGLATDVLSYLFKNSLPTYYPSQNVIVESGYSCVPLSMGTYRFYHWAYTNGYIIKPSSDYFTHFTFTSDFIKTVRSNINTAPQSVGEEIIIPHGVYSFNPYIDIQSSANLYFALEYICKALNLSLYFDNKLHAENRLSPQYSVQNPTVYHPQEFTRIIVGSLSSPTKSSTGFTDVTELVTTYNPGDSYYKLYGSETSYPLNWIMESKNVNTGSQSIIKAQTAFASANVCSAGIQYAGEKETGKDLDYSGIPVPDCGKSIYHAPYYRARGYGYVVGGMETTSLMLIAISLNEVVNGCEVYPSFSFTLQEFVDDAPVGTRINAEFHPEITSSAGLPTPSAVYLDKYIAIRCNDEAHNNTSLYKCIHDGTYQWINPTWSSGVISNGLYCLITNYPYISTFKFENGKWSDHTEIATMDAKRIETFTSNTLVHQATDTQNNIGGNNLLMSYVETQWPICKTVYCIGNNALTDSESLLNSLSESASTIASQKMEDVSTLSASSISVYGNMSTAEYASAQTNSSLSAFSGMIIKSQGLDGTLIGYKNGIEQLRITSDGTLWTGACYGLDSEGNPTTEVVGASVVLDNEGLRTYKTVPIPTVITIDDTPVSTYEYELREQCSINTDGEIIAGARLYKLDANGLSYNFGNYATPSWGTLLTYNPTEDVTELNSNIKVKNVIATGIEIIDSNSNMLLRGGLIDRGTALPDDTFQIFNPTYSTSLPVTRFNQNGQMVSGTSATGWTLLDNTGLKIFSPGNDPTTIGSSRTELMTIAGGEIVIGSLYKFNVNGLSYNFGTSSVPSWGQLLTYNSSTNETELNSNIKVQSVTANSLKIRDISNNLIIRGELVDRGVTLYDDVFQVYNPDDTSGNPVARFNQKGQFIVGAPSAGWSLLDNVGLRVYCAGDDPTTFGSTRRPLVAVTQGGFYMDTSVFDVGSADFTFGNGDGTCNTDIKLIKNASIRAAPKTYNDEIVGYAVRLGEWDEGGTIYNGLYTYHVNADSTLDLQCSINADGQITAGGGNVILDADGLSIIYDPDASEYIEQNALTFRSDDYTNIPLRLYHIEQTAEGVSKSISVIDAPESTDLSVFNYLRLNSGEGGAEIIPFSDIIPQTYGTGGGYILHTEEAVPVAHTVSLQAGQISVYSATKTYNRWMGYIPGTSTPISSQYPTTTTYKIVPSRNAFKVDSVKNLSYCIKDEDNPEVHTTNLSFLVGSWNGSVITGRARLPFDLSVQVPVTDSIKISSVNLGLNISSVLYNIQEAYEELVDGHFGLRTSVAVHIIKDEEDVKIGERTLSRLIETFKYVDSYDIDQTYNVSVPCYPETFTTGPFTLRFEIDVGAIGAPFPGEWSVGAFDDVYLNITSNSTYTYTSMEHSHLLESNFSTGHSYNLDTQSISIEISDTGTASQIYVGHFEESSTTPEIDYVLYTRDSSDHLALLPIKIAGLDGEVSIFANIPAGSSLSVPNIKVLGTNTIGSGGKIELSEKGQNLHGETIVEGNLTISKGDVMIDGIASGENILSGVCVKSNVNVIGGNFVLQPTNLQLSDSAIDQLYTAMKARHDTW